MEHRTSFASIAAASAGEFYVSEESSLDDAPAARRVDLDTSLVERGSDGNEMVVSDTDVPGPQKGSSESDEGEQLTALEQAKILDLFHIGCTCAGVNQRQVLVRLITFLTCYSYLVTTNISFLYPHMLIFPALKKYLLLITWI